MKFAIRVSINRQAMFLFQVIVEKAPNSQVPDIDKRKFLVPNDISVAQFMWIIRKRVQLPSEKALFLFVGKVLPQSRLVMFLHCQIYIFISFQLHKAICVNYA